MSMFLNDSQKSLETYLKQINMTPLLSAKEEKQLAFLIQQGDEQARKKFIEANLRFVVKIAKSYRCFSMSLLDLIQEGNIGLIEAVERFNPALGYRFSTFSAYWIRQAIQRAIAKKARTIRLPVRKFRAVAKLEQYREQFWLLHARYPTDAEIAQHFHISLAQVKSLMNYKDPSVSLDTPLDENGNRLGDMFEDDEFELPRDYAARTQLRDKLYTILNHLSEREKKILINRFGFEDGIAKSLRVISKRMGISQEGVRRIEQAAVAKLRRYSGCKQLQPTV
ncbi:MAG: sigma-70 family RNA polymerase sigma factor [bacterium]|nr:sigma-70 family RNA polymerase sigma factor [bacterium]